MQNSAHMQPFKETRKEGFSVWDNESLLQKDGVQMLYGEDGKLCHKISFAGHSIGKDRKQGMGPRTMQAVGLSCGCPYSTSHATGLEDMGQESVPKLMVHV
jgi:hypothetical protein